MILNEFDLAKHPWQLTIAISHILVDLMSNFYPPTIFFAVIQLILLDIIDLHQEWKRSMMLQNMK